MINDIDETIKQLLIHELGSLGLAYPANYEISFDLPDNDWESRISRLTANLYLYEVVENQTLRNNEQMKKFNTDRTVTRLKPPSRFDCKYLVSTWSAASPTDTVQEHLLLGQVLWALFRNPVIPPSFFQGYLTLLDPVPEIPCATAQPSNSEMPGQFWGSLENQWKSCFSYMVTIPLELNQPFISGPMVTTKIMRYEPIGRPQDREEFLLQIGGRIVNATDSSIGIAGATVFIEELNRSTRTDRSGFYIFSKIPNGTFTFKANADGFQPNDRTMPVPEPTGDYYITLTPI